MISNSDKQGLRYVPFCFTEVGIIMLSAVLRSTTAINMSIGASLKDLGKKWFAFSKMALSATEMLGKLQ